MNLLSDDKIVTIISNNEEETKEFGKLLGSLLKENSVVAINGQLGTGKTYFVKGVAKGLGVEDCGIVTSPTFAIVNQYTGRLPIFHIDAYRLKGSDELYDLGCDEMFWGNSVTIVEWADNVKDCLPDSLVNVNIEYMDGCKREISVFFTGSGNDDIFKGLNC